MNREYRSTTQSNTSINPSVVPQVDTRFSKKSPLPSDFAPGRKDVLIGRGKKCYNHIGNKELQRIVASRLQEYSDSSDKAEKSSILSSIVIQVREKGAFVKEDPDTGKWFDVGNQAAREKVAQTFRDALHQKYRSSTAFKTKKRRLEKKAAKCAHQSHKAGKSGFTTILSEHSGVPLNRFIDWQRQNMAITEFRSRNENFDVMSSLSSYFPLRIMEDEDPYEPIPIAQANEIGQVQSGPFQVSSNQDLYEPINVSDDDSHKSDTVDGGISKRRNQTQPFPFSNIHAAKTA